jgi:hypothetical protein
MSQAPETTEADLGTYPPLLPFFVTFVAFAPQLFATTEMGARMIIRITTFHFISPPRFQIMDKFISHRYLFCESPPSWKRSGAAMG